MVSPWAYHSRTVRRQPALISGWSLEAHRAAHLEHDAVVLVAEQEVAQVAAREAELVAARKIEVDPANREGGPVADARLTGEGALVAPGRTSWMKEETA